MFDVTGPLGTAKLTATEVMLLTAFARAPSCKLETWQIAEMLEIQLDDTMKSSITVRIARLRKKLVDTGAQGMVIESIRNVGYQIVAYVEIT